MIEIENFLDKYKNWHVKSGILVAKFDFGSFDEVQSFVDSVMKIAEELNHHPTVTFSYNWVKVETVTHDQQNSLTMKDIDLAEKISHLSSNSF